MPAFVWKSIAILVATSGAACAMNNGASEYGASDYEVLSGPLPPPPPAAASTAAAPAGSFGTPGASPSEDGGVVQPTPVYPPPPVTPAPPGTVGSPPITSDPYTAARDFCAQRINQYRATVGRAPLARVAAAEPCTDQQSAYDSQQGTAHGAFSYCHELAQNECPGWPGPLSNVLPSCLDSMWAEGPGGGHYDNMSSNKYQYVACGFYQTPNGSWWIVQDFR